MGLLFLFEVCYRSYRCLHLYRFAHLPLAKHGLTVVLGIYLTLMLVHAATACVALGWDAPIMVLAVYLGNLPNAFLSLFI